MTVWKCVGGLPTPGFGSFSSRNNTVFPAATRVHQSTLAASRFKCAASSGTVEEMARAALARKATRDELGSADAALLVVPRSGCLCARLPRCAGRTPPDLRKPVTDAQG